MSRVRRRLAGSAQAAFALVELIVVLVILTAVVAPLSGLLVAGLNTQADLNRRFQAQQEARLALNKLRREVHCASAISPAGASNVVTLVLPPQCPGGGGTTTWCTVSVATLRFALYHKAGATCDSGGKLYADYLTAGAVFDYLPPTTGSRRKLNVVFPVDLTPTDSVAAYRLVDALVLRNTAIV